MPWLRPFIEVGRYGLALEEIAGVLAQSKVPVTDQVRGGMLISPGPHDELDDLVLRALGFCPRAG